jgi:ATP-dependent protease ClpP protease subunit
MRSIQLTILFLSLIGNTIAQAQSLDPERTLYIEGAISGQTLDPLMDKLIDLTRKVFTDKNKEQINIIISSPGGEVISGNMFINKMVALRGLGVPIVCYVQDMAASMAFQTFTQCSKRYALTTSYLLWHGVRTRLQGPVTQLVAHSVAEDLQRMDDSVMVQLEDTLSLTSSELVRHFERETLWSGMQLRNADPGFLTVQDFYPEVSEVLINPHLTKSGSSMPGFDMGGQMDPVKHTYYLIWSRYQYMLNPMQGGN